MKTGLTEYQQLAITKLREIQEHRLYHGISATITEDDFRRINEAIKNADEIQVQKLRASEQALFALCGFTP